MQFLERCLCAALLLGGCSTPTGRLFCAVHSGDHDLVVGLVDIGVGLAMPEAEPVAVLATGATKAYVDAACAQAGGIPVTPPPDPDVAPVVAVALPPG